MVNRGVGSLPDALALFTIIPPRRVTIPFVKLIEILNIVDKNELNENRNNTW